MCLFFFQHNISKADAAGITKQTHETRPQYGDFSVFKMAAAPSWIFEISNF